MPTLNIGGQRVNVGDDFLSLSPDEQNQTVQGIASQLQGEPQPAAPAPEEEPKPAPGYIPSGQELSTDAMRAALQAVRNIGENFVAFPGETVAMGYRGMNYLAGKFPGVFGPQVPEERLRAFPLQPPGKAEVSGLTSKALEMAGLPSKPYEAKYWLGKTVAFPVEHAPELLTVSNLLEQLFPKALTNAPQLATEARPALKSVDELRGQVRTDYKAAREAGQNYTPQQYQYVVDKTAQAADAFKANPIRHPQTLSVLDDLKARLAQGAPPDSEELDALRSQLSTIVGTDKSAAERAAAGHLLRAFDKATEVVDASYPLRQAARQSNVMYEKAKVIQDLWDKAQRQADRTGADLAQVLRGKFNTLANNANRIRQFSTAERTAIDQFVRGGKLENVLTGLSKSTATGSLPAAALGYLTGGPLGAFAGPGASAILRQGMREIAGRMTLSKAQAIRALIQNPPAAAAEIARRFPQVSQEQIAKLVEEAARQAAALQGQ